MDAPSLSELIRSAVLGAVVCATLALPLASNAQTKPPTEEDAPIKISTDLLRIPIVASGPNREASSQLTKDDFRITSNGVGQEIAFFSSSDEPLSVAIVIDTSGSVVEILPDIKDAAKSLIRAMRTTDRGMIVTFDDKIKIVRGLTNDKKQLELGIWTVTHIPGGNNKMNQAVLAILNGQFGEIEGRKAIFVFTDAGEIDPESIPELRERLIMGDTLIYPIYFQTGWNWPRSKKSLPLEEVVKLTGADSLYDMARVSGGRFIVAENKKFKQEFEGIIGELERYYLVGIYANPETGRALKIESKRKDVSLRTKSVIRRSANIPWWPWFESQF
jgi:VWFA-related protein